MGARPGEPVVVDTRDEAVVLGRNDGRRLAHRCEDGMEGEVPLATTVAQVGKDQRQHHGTSRNTLLVERVGSDLPRVGQHVGLGVPLVDDKLKVGAPCHGRSKAGG